MRGAPYPDGHDVLGRLVQHIYEAGLACEGVCDADPETAARIGRAADELDAALRVIRSSACRRDSVP